MRRLISIMVVALTSLSQAVAEGDYERGKALAKAWECMDCHGLTGNERWPDTPKAAVPMLAGQPTRYLVKSLKEFRAGDRIDGSELQKMTLLTQGLTDQDIEDVAAYYSAQKRY